MRVRFKNAVVPLGEIAEMLGGKLQGDPAAVVSGICSLDHPKEGGIAFCTKKSTKSLESELRDLKLTAVLINAELNGDFDDISLHLIKVKDPVAAFVKILPLFIEPLTPAPGISAKADIHPTAEIGKDVYIGPFCSVGENAKIGDRAVIYPNAVIYPEASIGKEAVIHSGAVIREGCTVGANCTIQNGAVIGADGFGYFPEDSILKPVPQIGRTVIKDNADIGANTCVDRATIGATSIGDNSKLDNMVQIGHNTTIGAQSIVCGQTGIAGSCKIGSGVTLGGGVGIADHVAIADGTRIAAGSGVMSDVTEKGDYGGIPARSFHTWKRQIAALSKLPDLIRNLKKS